VRSLMGASPKQPCRANTSACCHLGKPHRICHFTPDNPACG
jgi:hypothetical protein